MAVEEQLFPVRSRADWLAQLSAVGGRGWCRHSRCLRSLGKWYWFVGRRCCCSTMRSRLLSPLMVCTITSSASTATIGGPGRHGMASVSMSRWWQVVSMVSRCVMMVMIAIVMVAVVAFLLCFMFSLSIVFVARLVYWQLANFSWQRLNPEIVMIRCCECRQPFCWIKDQKFVHQVRSKSAISIRKRVVGLEINLEARTSCDGAKMKILPVNLNSLRLKVLLQFPWIAPVYLIDNPFLLQAWQGGPSWHSVLGRRTAKLKYFVELILIRVSLQNRPTKQHLSENATE